MNLSWMFYFCNYKNKIAISTSDLTQQISKYEILKQDFTFNNFGNEIIFKYLVEHGADINKKDPIDIISANFIYKNILALLVFLLSTYYLCFLIFLMILKDYSLLFLQRSKYINNTYSENKMINIIARPSTTKSLTLRFTKNGIKNIELSVDFVDSVDSVVFFDFSEFLLFLTGK
ncbi:hypothetical protein H8356DRAFT_1427254 [Neocallimastix lanati (nom. inval.)]|nr:hypothetical protein H8356DRAFT_1427254 [Neocallimastix sp. JGI-2020a]